MNPVELVAPHRIPPLRVLLALDRDALRLGALVGTGDPYGQHACVIRRRDRVARDVSGQLERATERPVADLAERAPVLFLGAFVAAFATNDELALVDLDVDVLLDVDTGQLEANDGIVAVSGDLRGRAEAVEHALLHPAVDLP